MFPTNISLEEMYCSIFIFLVLTFNKPLLSMYYASGSLVAGTRNMETQIQSLILRNSHSSGEKDKHTDVYESVVSAKMEPLVTQVGGGVGIR